MGVSEEWFLVSGGRVAVIIPALGELEYVEYSGDEVPRSRAHSRCWRSSPIWALCYTRCTNEPCM